MKTEHENSIPDRLALWLRDRIARVFYGPISVAAVLFVSAPFALADPAPPLAWECWIGNKPPISIYCIQPRSLTDLATMEDPDYELEAMLLEVIHQRIVSGQTAGLEEFVKDHSREVRREYLQVITIWSYPNETSWWEGTPVRLVRAALCPGEPLCSVMLKRPSR